MTPRQNLARSLAHSYSLVLNYHEKVSVPCPHCTVNADEDCITPAGNPTKSAHAERIIAAWRSQFPPFDVKVRVRQRDRVVRDPEAHTFAERAAGAKSLKQLRQECKYRKVAADIIEGINR